MELPNPLFQIAFGECIREATEALRTAALCVVLPRNSIAPGCSAHLLPRLSVLLALLARVKRPSLEQRRLLSAIIDIVFALDPKNDRSARILLSRIARSIEWISDGGDQGYHFYHLKRIERAVR